MEIDGLDSAKCQKSRKGDMMGINRNVNDNKTKDEQYSSSPFEGQKREKMRWVLEL